MQQRQRSNASPLNHSVGVLQQGPENEDVYSLALFPGKSMFISYANSPCENTVNELGPKCLFSPFSIQQKSPMVTRKVSLKWPRQVAKRAGEESLQSIVRTSPSSQWFLALKDLSMFPLIGDEFVPKKEIFAKLIYSANEAISRKHGGVTFDRKTKETTIKYFEKSLFVKNVFALCHKHHPQLTLRQAPPLYKTSHMKEFILHCNE